MNQDKKQKQTDIYNYIFSDNQDIYLIEWLEKSRQDLHEKSIDLYIKNFNDVNSESQIERVKHNFKAKIKKFLLDSIEHLMEQVTIARVQRTKNPLFSEFIARPEDLHGNIFISNELEKDSKITAKVISGATWINAITNWPILYYAFQNWGTLIALSSATTLNFLVLTWTNHAGTAAAGGNKGKWFWSFTGIISFFMISMLQSMVAGVGAELINNQRELSELKAQEIVDNYLSQLRDNLNQVEARYQENIEDCDNNSRELRDMDYWNPRRNSLWLETYGPYGAENPDAICPTATRQQNEIDTREKSLEKLKNERQKLGNLVFAQNNLGARYSQYFDENGKILSGVIAVEFAINNFWGKFTTQEFEKLGFSLFFLLLSTITSIGALLMTLTYAIKYTTKMSRSSKVEQSVNLWLNEVWYSYIARENELDGHDTTFLSPDLKMDLKQKKYRGFLLSLFMQEIQKTGRLGYPALEQIAQAANQHPDYVFKLIQYRQLIDRINKSSNNVTEASITIKNKIFNVILLSEEQINENSVVADFNIDEDFQKLSYGIHNLININHESIEDSFSIWDFFISKLLDVHSPSNVSQNSSEDTIKKIWQELNSKCNLSWILWGDVSSINRNPDINSYNSQYEAEVRKNRCLEVSQKLSQLSGYCHEFSVIISNSLKNQVDKARLIPAKTNSSAPKENLPEEKS